MKEITTLQVEKETREKLKLLRITSRETYDEILNRLIKKELNEKELSKE